MLLQCSNCGAPLDGRGGGRTLACAYCGRTNVVESMTTIAHQVPPSWTPPRTWTPPEAFPHQSGPLSYQAPGAAVVPGIIWASFSILMTVGIGVAVTAGALRGSSRSSPVGGGAIIETAQGRADAWDGRSTLVCMDRITIRNKTADTGNLVALIANDGCQLTLVNCRVRGETGLIANGNARVIVSGGSVTGWNHSVIANGGATVELRGGGRVVGAVIENGGGRLIR